MVSTAQTQWQYKSTTRIYSPDDQPGLHDDIGRAWLKSAMDALPHGGGLLDLGCGSGRIIFAMKERWSPGGWAIGADTNPAALDSARQISEERNLSNVLFVNHDVEEEDYASLLGGKSPDLVTAHLCMGEEIIGHTSRILPRGATFACVALHPDLWKETGRTSRFALGEKKIDELLNKYELTPSFLRVERLVIEFKSGTDAAAGFFQDGKTVPRWHKDGRWEKLLEYLNSGGRSLTALAQTQIIAQKMSS